MSFSCSDVSGDVIIYSCLHCMLKDTQLDHWGCTGWCIQSVHWDHHRCPLHRCSQRIQKKWWFPLVSAGTHIGNVNIFLP